jgi:hypothetical protein
VAKVQVTNDCAKTDFGRILYKVLTNYKLQQSKDHPFEKIYILSIVLGKTRKTTK